ERSRGHRIDGCSAIGGRDPRDAAEADALIGEIARLILARLAIDAVRIDLAVMDAAGLLGKPIADVIAIGLDLLPQLDQRRAELRRRDRRHCLARPSEARCHHRFLDRGTDAFGAPDLACCPLRPESVPATKSPP